MKFQTYANVVALMTLAILGTGCSGSSVPGTVSNAITPISNPGVAGPQTSKSVTKRTVKLFIPAAPVGRKTASTQKLTLASKSTGSVRSPKYVSYASSTFTITTAQNQAQIDKQTFSTDPQTNPNCVTAAPGQPAGTNCSFTIGLLSGTDIVFVTGYDNNNVPLENYTGTVTVAAGVNNTIGLTLGGVVTSYSLAAQNYPTPTGTGGNGATLSLQGDGPAKEIDFSLVAMDNSGQVVLSSPSNPYANNIVTNLSENNTSGANGYSTIALRSTDQGGNVTTGAAGTNVTSTNGSDVIVYKYSGNAPTGYTAKLDTIASQFIDPNGSTASTNTPDTVTNLAPLYLVNDGSSVLDTGTTFALDPTTFIPTITQTETTGSMNNVNLALTTGLVSNEPNDPGAPQPGNPVDTQAGGTTCSNVVFPNDGQSNNVYLPQVMGGAAQTCQFNIGDGTTGGTQLLDVVYNPPAGQVLSAYPSSNTGYCSGGGCNGTYNSQTVYTMYDVGDPSPSFASTGCQADTNSGCYYDNTTNDGSGDSYQYCLNGSGGAAVFTNRGVPSFISFLGDYSSGYSNDPNSGNTGSFTCSVTESDERGNSVIIKATLDIDLTQQPTSKNRKPYSVNGSKTFTLTASGRPTAALATYIARTEKAQAESAAIREKAMAILKRMPAKHV